MNQLQSLINDYSFYPNQDQMDLTPIYENRDFDFYIKRYEDFIEYINNFRVYYYILLYDQPFIQQYEANVEEIIKEIQEIKYMFYVIVFNRNNYLSQNPTVPYSIKDEIEKFSVVDLSMKKDLKEYQLQKDKLIEMINSNTAMIEEFNEISSEIDRKMYKLEFI